MRESVRGLFMGCICSKRAIRFRRGHGGGGGGGGGIHLRKISKSKRTHGSRKKKDGENLNANGANPAIGNGGASDGREESELAIVGTNISNNDNIYVSDDDGRRVGERFAGLRISPVMHNALEGEQNAAGWPTWLTSVASEAIKGVTARKGGDFTILEQVGQGTYSTVFKAQDKSSKAMVVLKKVRFLNMDPESVEFMSREIEIVKNLDHPNIIKLKGIVTSHTSKNLYLVFDYMDHDLAGLLANPAVKFTEPQVKCLMKQLFSALDHCHTRGVLHRDIKGSNLLVSHQGVLQLADFGLATHFDPTKTEPLTARVVTLWYRPPELLLGATEYDFSIDLWSTGCLLGELFAGKPLMSGRTEVEQLHKIFKLCGSPSPDYWKISKLPHTTIFQPRDHYKRCLRKTYKDFPSSALDLLDVLLAIKPEERGTANSALNSEFFTTKPLECKPSELPKYPPSKEMDAIFHAPDHKTDSDEDGLPESASSSISSAFVNKLSQEHSKVNTGNNQSEVDRKGKKIDNMSYTYLYHSGPLSKNVSGLIGCSWDTTGNKKKGFISSLKHSFKLSRGGGEKESKGSFNILSDNAKRISRELTALRAANMRKSSTVQTWEDPIDHVTSSTHEEDDERRKKATTRALGDRTINYSGPLIAPGESVDDVLKEHDKRIQRALRKSFLGKDKAGENSDHDGP